MARLREAAPTPPGCRPLPARDGGTGALRRRQGPTHGAGRQRLLCPRHRRRLPQDDVRYSITIRQHKSLRHLIEAIPETDWTPIPYWMDGAADVAETTYTPFESEPGAAPVRLIVRRVKPTPGSQLALFASYSYHGFITDRDGETLELEADHRPPRRDRERHPRPQVRRRAEPPAVRPIRCQRGLAGGAGDGPQPRSLDSAYRSG